MIDGLTRCIKDNHAFLNDPSFFNSSGHDLMSFNEDDEQKPI